MKLKRLEIYGFKSFAQRTEVVFNDGITGIVGPNGSGKSNIGDAVKWVLGEQNPRELRGGAMQDVIFNGTEKRKKLAFAEVTLVLDNEDRALRLDQPEVAVTRRLYRNGESEYSLNRRSCRLKDIRELFYDTGIGKDGYSNIGQGRIDDILSNNSEDRREVFEEAAGISMYRIRKEEAERKLNRTLENLDRVRDLLEELGSRIDPLHEQAQSALKYQELSARLKTLEMNIFLVRQDTLTQKMQELNDTMDQLRDVLLQQEARLNELAVDRDKVSETLQALDDAIAQARADSRMCTEELHQTQTRYERTEQKKENCDQELQSLAKEREARHKRLEELRELTGKGAQDDAAAAKMLADAEKQLQQSTQACEEAEAEAQQAEETLSRHKEDILNAVNHLSDVRNAQTQQEAMAAQMKNYLSQLTQSRQELLEQVQDARQRCAEAETNRQAESERLEQDRQEASRLEVSAMKMRAEGEESNRTLQQLAMGVQSEQARLKTLREMEQAMDGYANAVRRALQYARGNAKVYGAVAQLMRVPREMEMAIDAVLGGSLQHIVTADDVTAKELIEYLKRSEGGRATFLPLNTVRPYSLSGEERRVLSMPGCLGVASELVDCNPRFRPVIDNLLGRTVVASNLDQALPIMRAGRYAFRLVTLDGQVMHSGGSMTGGSMRGKASPFLSREREITELSQSIAQKQKRLAEVQDSLLRLNSALEEAERLRGEALEVMHQQEIAVTREQEHVFNANNERQALEERLQKTEDGIRQLTESLEQTQKDLDRFAQGTTEATVDREALEEKTGLLQRQMAAAREKADTLREQVTAEKLRYAQMENAILVLRRDQERYHQELETMSASLNTLQERTAAKEAERQDLGAQLETLQGQIADQRTRADAAEEEAQALDQKRQGETERQRVMVLESESLHRQHDENSESMHRAQLQYERADSDRNNLQDHMWNTYEATLAVAEEYRLPKEEFTITAGERDAAALRREIRSLGPINAHAVEQYAETKERFDELSRQQEDMVKAEADLRGLIKRLMGQMEKQFVDEFGKLNGFFQQTFVRLFGGGRAELKLEDENDPLSCRIEVIAQPPGKKLQLLSLLSGGERALTAIAILFAMLKLRPTPFCILDEIEAALDEANIGYFADYLSEYAKTTQFVVVTHRKGTMERCNALYGVAMEEKGVSSMMSVNLDDYMA